MKKITLFTLLLALMLVVAACGGGDESGDDTDTANDPEPTAVTESNGDATDTTADATTEATEEPAFIEGPPVNDLDICAIIDAEVVAGAIGEFTEDPANELVPTLQGVTRANGCRYTTADGSVYIGVVRLTEQFQRVVRLSSRPTPAPELAPETGLGFISSDGSFVIFPELVIVGIRHDGLDTETLITLADATAAAIEANTE